MLRPHVTLSRQQIAALNLLHEAEKKALSSRMAALEYEYAQLRAVCAAQNERLRYARCVVNAVQTGTAASGTRSESSMNYQIH